MVNEHQWERVNEKPLYSMGADAGRIVCAVAALWRDECKPVRADVHHEYACKSVQTQAVVEYIDRKSHGKSGKHEDQRISFHGEEEQIGDVQKAKGGVEKNNILQDQHLVEKVNEERNNLDDVEPRHFFASSIKGLSIESCSCFK